LKHTICRKVRNFKKQNTIFVSHLILVIILKLTITIINFAGLNKQYIQQNFILILILSFILIASLQITGASITTICTLANGIVFIYFMMVKIFVSSYNPQITKARVYYKHKSYITLNSGLSMRVGISEAIRMLFFICLKLLFIFIYPFKIKQQNKALILFKYLFTGHKRFIVPTLVYAKPAKLSFKTLFLKNTTTASDKEEYKSNIKNLKPLIYNNLNSSVVPGTTTIKPEDKQFNQWLAGLIDGEGCFKLSKKGYASLEIVSHIRDKNCLYQIKQKFGGAVKLRTNLNHLRFRMHHKQGILDIINAVNGEIRNPIRLLQLSKICDKYNIPVIHPIPLTYDNGWLSGFFDSDGSIYLNLKSSQVLITASQKNKYLLDILCELYGGSIYIEKTSFKWIVYRKSEISKLLEYFKLNPCRSAKLNRINAIPKYFDLRDIKAHLQEESTILGKAWKKFLLRWDK